ncbi:MAG: aspartate ammonia-lyase [Candidatus Omnitrophica bacterium]|nr:aspartate ammonia-lyase [Candidatus Omnitrophota bacterium]
MTRFRVERDSLGPMKVPSRAYYGVQTARARENFPVSNLTFPVAMIRAFGLIKLAAATANMQVGRLDRRRGQAIARAARELISNKNGLQKEIVVDVYQAGAGTSLNMNVNEVIANRGIELLGGRRGDYKRIHPNDHVNMAQSTNDVTPTAIRLGILFVLPGLLEVLEELEGVLRKKARAFDRVIKSGRTHLQDAVPIRLGQEMSGYARVIEKARGRISSAREALYELNLGGTAVGTGLNSHPRYRQIAIRFIRRQTRFPVVPAKNLFEVTQSMSDVTHVSHAVRLLALELTKIANDFRLLDSGPRTGLAELKLPAVQPGSSIMPGKVNPVMAEMLNQVCFHVIGHDLTVAIASQAGQLELNVMMPLMGHTLITSIQVLANGIRLFNDRCLWGVEADAKRCRDYAERSLGLATALNPTIGYAKSAELVKEAVKRDVSIRKVMEEHGILKDPKIRRLMDDPFALTKPS